MKATTRGYNPDYSDEAPTREDIAAMPGTVLLEFGAPWCGHCMAARPAVQEALAAYPDLPHIKVHDGKGKPLGRAFGVKLWPTLIILESGEEKHRLVRPTRSGPIRDALAEVT